MIYKVQTRGRVHISLGKNTLFWEGDGRAQFIDSNGEKDRLFIASNTGMKFFAGRMGVWEKLI